MVGSPANNAASSLDLHLASITQQLLGEALSRATRKAYLRTLKMLLELYRSTSTSFVFPCSLAIFCNFISHLHSQSLRPSTILSRVSAISYVHKIFTVTDPTHQFLDRKIFKSAQNLKKSSDLMLPITKPILLRILAALHHTVQIKMAYVCYVQFFFLHFMDFSDLEN